MKHMEELLDIEDYDAAYLYFMSLEDTQKKEWFECLCKKNKSLIDLSSMKTVSIFRRKLKPGKTFKDFFYAWLPPECNPSGSLKEIKEQFIEYWSAHAKGIGGGVFHAENLQDSSEILSVGLMDIESGELSKMIGSAMETERQRDDRIDEVTDLIGDPAVYRIVDTIP